MVQNVGLPYWRSVGRNFPGIFRKSWTNRWELKVPDFLTLISDKNASFPGHFGRTGIATEMAPKNEAFLAAIRAQKEAYAEWWWVCRDFLMVGRP